MVLSQRRDERVTVRLNQECVFIKAMRRGGVGILEMREENYRELDWGVGGRGTKSFEQRSEKYEPAHVPLVVRITGCSFLAFLIFYLCSVSRYALRNKGANC